MAKVIKNNLGYLGVDFQYKLIKTFLDEPSFFRELYPIIDQQNTFTDTTLKTFVGVLKDYFNKNDLVPSYTMMGIKLNEKAYSEIDSQTYAETLQRIKETSTEGVAEIREMAERFFRQQNLIRVANEILKIAGDGDLDRYDDCLKLLDDASNVGAEDDLGESPLDEIEDTLSVNHRITIPTGIKNIDDALEGGIAIGELGVIIGPTSFGKAQPLDANVLTPYGWKKMGDIKVGDEVIGRKGERNKVTGVFPQGLRPIYKVSFSNGTSCECDIEHLWNVNSLYQRSGKKYVKGVSKNRNDKFYIPDKSYKTLSLKEIIEKGFIRENGKKYNFKVPKCEVVNFAEAYTAFDPYLIGYLIGDGNLKRLSISVGNKDKDEIYSYLYDIIGDDLHAFYREKRNIWQFDIAGETKKLIKNRFIYKKSDEKEIPIEYVINSKEKRIALLQGLMDSDGSCNKNGSCEFCSKSLGLAKQVQFLVRSLGGFASLTEGKSGYFSKKYNKYVDCGTRYRVTISMCNEDISIFRLKRKKERVKYRTKLKDAIFITGAEYIGEKEAQCIMVDSDEHLYITDDFIVTHNTSLTTAMASHAATYKCESNNNNGFKVLQIVFEDRVKQIKRKHIAKITQVEAKDLSKPDYIDLVRNTLDAYPDKELIKNNIRIKRYPSGQKTPNDIKNFIKRQINSGFKPDLVIIDYFECLEPDRQRHLSNENEWSKEGRTMRTIESMADELGVAIWVPTQGSKDSIGAELVTMEKAGGSVKKIQIGHIILSIARSMENIKENKANIAILKNRAGQAGMIMNGINFNNGTCTVSSNDIIEFDDALKYHEYEKEATATAIHNIGKEIFNEYRNKQ